MPCFHLRLSMEVWSPNHVAKTLFLPIPSVADHIHFQPSTFKWNHQEFFMKRMHPLLSIVKSSKLQTLQTNADVEKQISGLSESKQSSVYLTSLDKQPLIEKAYGSCGSFIDEVNKEEQRRIKIGLSNRGKAAWNKGMQHSKETRERISQRTAEALSDPKVRKKMSENHRRSHSDQTKAKIKTALKRVWDKRMNWKLSKEKFVLSWSQSIAEAARKGASDQHELDWDSFIKIKQEIAINQLQWTGKEVKDKRLLKERAKESALARAEKSALAKAKRIARFAEKRKEREERMEERRIKKAFEKAEREKKKTTELNLKKTLTKMLRKKQVHNRVAIVPNKGISSIPNLEKLDLDLIKEEKLRQVISLADQIQAAKSKRADTNLA